DITLEQAMNGTQPTVQPTKRAASAAPEVWELSDDMDLITRPLQIIDDNAYLVTCLRTKTTSNEGARQGRHQFALSWNSGGLVAFGPPIEGVRPIDELPVVVDLPFQLPTR